MSNIKPYFKDAIKQKASDLHLIAGEKPTLRVDGELKDLEDKPLSAKELEEGILSLLSGD